MKNYIIHSIENFKEIAKSIRAFSMTTDICTTKIETVTGKGIKLEGFTSNQSNIKIEDMINNISYQYYDTAENIRILSEEIMEEKGK